MAKKLDQPQSNLSVIREDLEDLKNDVVEDGAKLFTDIKEQSLIASREMKRKTRDQIADLRRQLEELEEAAGREFSHNVHKMEKRVRERPTESIALAFAAGIIASFLLGRRG